MTTEAQRPDSTNPAGEQAGEAMRLAAAAKEAVAMIGYEFGAREAARTNIDRLAALAAILREALAQPPAAAPRDESILAGAPQHEIVRPRTRGSWHHRHRPQQRRAQVGGTVPGKTERA